MGEFQGFRKPEQNWHKMPNEWTDITRNITSLAELKVIEYIIRHTWGYSEYDNLKRISIDEFENGRKASDGSRLDGGTGLSRQSILNGIKRAIEDGFIVSEVVGEDAGRRRKYYGVKMLDFGGLKCRPDGSKILTPYIERQLRKNTLSSPNGLDGECVDLEKKNDDKRPSTWDYRAARELKAAIEQVMKLNKTSNMKQWANVFRLMRQVDKIPKREIREAIEWYRKHIGEEYLVVILSAKAFREKWERLNLARMRSKGTRARRIKRGIKGDWTDPIEDYPGSLENAVNAYLLEHYNLPMDEPTDDQGIVDEALQALGEEPGTIKVLKQGWV